ncbi:hypothetical protein E3Q13_02680 [Wallemia mellicola]|nr:hypothetical protein E3Q13_02680 [Wallemia mellicola]
MDISAYTKSIALSTTLAGFIKVSNFLVNQLSLRYVDPANLGRHSFKLELFYASIQQLSKDSVGLASLSASISNQQSINLAFLAIPLNVITLLITRVLFIGSNIGDADYNRALTLYTLSILLEALVEPLKYQSNKRVEIKRKSFIDSFSFAAKALVSFILLTRYSNHSSLTCYAFGQLSYSLIQFVSYCGDITIHYPRILANEAPFSKASLLSLRALITQALIKLGLTQGDKYIISSHLSDSDQGAFALADNYGSMVARIVFLPIEENSRVYFSKNESVEQVSNAIGLILRSYMLFLVVLPAFLPNYARTLLQILLPKYANSNAGSILPHYSIYIPIMAFNGILESFLHSTATSSVINKHSRFLIILSVILMPSIYFSLKYTPSCYHSIIVVYANIINLGLRSLYAYRYTSSSLNIPKITPNKVVLLACGVTGAITSYSISLSLVQHIITGGVCALSVLLVIVITEQKFYLSTIDKIKLYNNDIKSK